MSACQWDTPFRTCHAGGEVRRVLLPMPRNGTQLTVAEPVNARRPPGARPGDDPEQPWHSAWPLGAGERDGSAGGAGIRHQIQGRVGMWRGGGRLGMSVSAPFVWRCLSGSAIAPFPHPSHRTQRADFPHCALGQDFTPSSTARRVQAGSDARARRSRRGARVDSCRPCFVWSCA